MIKQVTIKILNETEVAVIGLSRSEHDYFYEKYGVFQEGYFFSPMYTLGRWDGKKRFFSKGGMTYFNLIEEIIPEIQKMGHKLKLIDERSPATINIPEIDSNYFNQYENIVLGKHQVDSVNKLTQNNGGIVEAATGAGKSLITAALSDLYNIHANLKTIVIVPSADLIVQTKAEYTRVGIDVGEYSGKNKDVNHLNVISTWQAIQYNPQILSMFQVLIIDECHGCKSTTLHEISTKHGSHFLVRIGLTGTIPKHDCDAMNVRVSLGDIIYKVSANYLITIGWLATLQININILTEPMDKEWALYKESFPEEAAKITQKKFKKTYFPDYKAETSYVETKNVRNQFVGDFIEELRSRPKGNTLVLTKNLTAARKLSKFIKNSIVVWNKDTTKARTAIYESFAEHNDIVVIATSQLASTGLNIKRIFHVILFDPNKSFVQVIQSIGRGLRKAFDKDHVEVYEFISDLKYSIQHYEKRLKYYDEKLYPYKIKNIDYQKMYIFDETVVF